MSLARAITCDLDAIDAAAVAVVAAESTVAQKLICRVLERSNHQVAAVCENGDDAIRLAMRERPSLMALGPGLGEIDDVHVALAIRHFWDSPSSLLDPAIESRAGVRKEPEHVVSPPGGRVAGSAGARPGIWRFLGAHRPPPSKDVTLTANDMVLFDHVVSWPWRAPTQLPSPGPFRLVG